MAGELHRGELLDFHQFGAVLAVSASIMNSRPLSLKNTSIGEFVTISPQDILLGRTTKSRGQLDKDIEAAGELEDDVRLTAMDEAQSKIVKQWRKNWLTSVFPDMVPRSKWRVTERNLGVGDLGHL